MAVPVSLQCGIVALVGYLIYQLTMSHQKSSRQLPPGPKGLPIVGNIFNMPPTNMPEALRWLPYKDKYGPISSVTAMGTTLVFIHDRKAVVELLEQSSIKTAGRSSNTFANELCGYKNILVCQQTNDERFRRHRGMIHRELGTQASAARFRDVQDIEVKRQLVRMLREPETWLGQFERTTAATVLKMVYGYSVGPERSDVLANLQNQVMANFSQAAAPGTWLVDVLPALKYVPEGFPGAEFKKTARKWKKTLEDGATLPFKFVQRQMASSGECPPSYVSKLLQQVRDGDSSMVSPEDEEAIIWTAQGLYGAALETTSTLMHSFTLAMVTHPAVQRKAQEEIDRVVGTSRLPGFEDRDKLPYVEALIKEVMRWWTVTPVGFPHVATEDLEYGGLHIPSGAALMPCVWWFMHDPEVYPNPDAFEPERFLSPRNELDPAADTFGYGRRICPGRFFADAGLYINIVRCLATFSLGKALDERGNEIEVEIKMQPGFISHPAHFALRATPRSAQHELLVTQLEQELPAETSDADKL